MTTGAGPVEPVDLSVLNVDPLLIIEGACEEVMRGMEAESVDAIVTDPPAGISFMGKSWDHDRGGRQQWVAWMTEVMRECYRVAKPGAHAVVWALPRTSHWTATAIEDAGWDVREVVTHLFGSGFPKSLSVDKAMDRAAGVQREDKFEGSFDRRAGPTGNKKCDTCGKWLVSGTPCQCPRPQDEPQTDLAKKWQGWGTALKPAAEFWIVARKPLIGTAVNVVKVVELSLRERGVGEIRWTASPVEPAAQLGRQATSYRTSGTQTASGSVGRANDLATPLIENATEMPSDLLAESGPLRTQTESEKCASALTQNSEPKSSMPMAENAPAAANASATSSPSITSAAAEQSTDERRGARSTLPSVAPDSRRVIESFAGIATGLTGSMAHVLIERLENGSFVWPDNLPRQVAGGPLTVAANVERFGTGALNIDGTRIGVDPSDPLRTAVHVGGTPGDGGKTMGSNWARAGENTPMWSGKGRWPANAVLSHSEGCEKRGTRKVRGHRGYPNGPGGSSSQFSQKGTPTTRDKPWSGITDAEVAAWDCEPECAVRLLDEQSGTLQSGDGTGSVRGEHPSPIVYGEYAGGTPLVTYGDRGGASRFFATFGRDPLPIEQDATRFMYTAKASGDDRSPTLTKDDRVRIRELRSKNESLPPELEAKIGKHPTTKPVDLMKWLLTLVMPPRTADYVPIALDPFAGSGTTGQAALALGYRCVLIEREAEYVRGIRSWRGAMQVGLGL